MTSAAPDWGTTTLPWCSFSVDDGPRRVGVGVGRSVLDAGAALPWLADEVADGTLDALLAKLAPVDLVLVEGYKRDGHAKVEAHRAETGNALIAPEDPTIKAIASDTPMTLDRPVFDLNDTSAIADFILAEVGL